jgi:RIMS-binding protein 2
MPVLSLHNTYTLPSGSASYTLGLSGAPVASSYTYPTVGQSTVGTSVGLSGVLGGASGLSSVGLGTTGHSLLSTGLGTGLNLTSTNLLSSDLGGTSRLTSLGLGYNTSYSTYTNPLITSGAMKLKTLDDFDIGINRYNRVGTPCSPIPGSWGLDSYSRLEGVNPGFMHSQSRPLSRLGALDDLEGEPTFLSHFRLFAYLKIHTLFLLSFKRNFSFNSQIQSKQKIYIKKKEEVQKFLLVNF